MFGLIDYSLKNSFIEEGSIDSLFSYSTGCGSDKIISALQDKDTFKLLKICDFIKSELVRNNKITRNMTQYQLYKNGGIPRSTISVTVDGKYKTVKLDTIYQIVATLGITLKDFFDDDLFEDLED